MAFAVMNVELVNPVLKNMVDMLSVMAQLEVQPGKPMLKKDMKALGEVTGMLRVEGEGVLGSLAISFSRPVIFTLCRRMLQRQPSGVDNWVLDLAGEIANMVTGGAKSALEERGYNLSMTLPEVLHGPDHVVEHHIPTRIIVLPFYSAPGDMFVEMCFDYDPAACPVAQRRRTGMQ